LSEHQHDRRPLTHPVEDPGRGSREASPAPAEPGPAAQESRGELEREALAEAIRERDEYLDALQRLKAEFDNYRKRVAREQEQVVVRAAEKLVKQLLPLLDDLERAVEAAAEEGAFDPHTQEALLSQSSPEPEGSVIQVVQKGYRLGDHVLRPARVVVSSGPAAEHSGSDHGV
jgi:molecular chaperone GrpE